MRSRWYLLGVSVLVMLGARGSQADSPSAPTSTPTSTIEYRLIVNQDNPVTSVSRRFVADAFLKKVTQWGDLFAIRPVDLRVDAAARRDFSREVLNRSVAAVRIYWQQQVFSGRDVPPPELDSDQEVMSYVAKHPGGLGYVSTAATLRGVKPLAVK